MDFQHFAERISKIRKPSPKEAGGNAFHNLVRSNFTISTWLALGALLQGALVLFTRPTYALAPTVLLLSYRLTTTLLMSMGVIRNSMLDDVLMGRFTVQLPDEHGNAPSKPSEQKIAIIMLAIRPNHPMGIFSPGYKELSGWFNDMIENLEKDKESGYLGSNAWLSFRDRRTGLQNMSCLYFRSAEDIHRFAHGPLHREAWNWWNTMIKKYPHMCIMHELYEAPSNRWENVFVNYHMSAVAGINAPIIQDGQEFNPIFNADRGLLKTHKTRLGKQENGSHGEKQRGYIGQGHDLA